MRTMHETTTEQKVKAFLQEAAREDVPRLPTAAQLWWRAELLRDLAKKEKQERRATRPALVGQGVALAAWVLTLSWGIPAVAAGSLGMAEWTAVAMAVTLVPVAGAAALLASGSEP